MFRAKIKWSPCELDHLKAHQTESINQLSGYLGKSRAAVKRKIDEINGIAVPDKKKSGKRTNIGKRPDLGGLFLRSSWEANVARLLNHEKLVWEFEPQVFVFDKIKHGTVSYCPDFKVHTPKGYIWVEVKGQLKPTDKTRIRRLKKFYPEEFAKVMCVVGSKKTKAAEFFESMDIPVLWYYNEINKEYKNTIPHWE